MERYKVFGTHEPGTIAQMDKIFALEEIKKGVLCADGHLGFSVPIGGVIALKEQVSPNAVGFDIACGNKAVRLDSVSEEVRKNIPLIMDKIQKHISFGVGRKNKEYIDHELFHAKEWSEVPLLKELKTKAMEQLGTVGSGNHYVDVFVDNENRIWVGAHFGSRGLGHSICTHFMHAAGGKEGINADLVIFDEHSDLGEQYIKCMEIAGRYAYAGRDWVCEKAAELIGGNIVEEVHNHHNFAWRETHGNQKYWVIRKGATPAFPGQKGFVGGSMGDVSVILEGVDSDESNEALYSTIHGAGRILGRMMAKGKKTRKGKVLREGLVKKEEMLSWIREKGVELRGGDVDESPHCYRRIEEVLEAHKNTIRVLNTLYPIGVCMAGNDVFDPYKD
jgi:tRNA-splicing ligase RtcB (3'-phosphate/5'-hydroxy nucleic acid ligase)